MTQTAFGLRIESPGSAAKASYALSRRRTVVGSATSCDLQLEGEGVSSIHAIVESDAATGRVVVYDLASDAGLKVNGQATVQAELKPGDKLEIGSHTLVLKRAEDLEVTASRIIEDRSPFLLEEGEHLQDIFDYSGESTKSLQVVMLYSGVIMEVSHFNRTKKIMIGPKHSDDFGVPPLLGVSAPSRYELISCTNGEYALNLHDSMTGVVSMGGALTPVKKIVTDAQRSKVLPLGEKDFAKLDMGDVSFFVNFTPSPPRLKHQRIFTRDPLFFRIWMASLGVTLMLTYALSRIVVNPQMEIEQLPERIATIIYKPELLPIEQPKPKAPVEQPKVEPQQAPPKPKPQVIKVTPKEPKKPAPKNPMIGKEEPKRPQPKAQHAPAPKPKPAPPKPAANKGGDEGAGARAAGESGTRGKQNAKPSDTHQTKATRPGTAPSNAPAVARAGRSQVQDMGVVDVFKGSTGTLNKILAGGKGASGAADKLEGYGGFTTQGAGGLGDAGGGAGGGGQSMGLGGLADKGVGGGRKGTGLGALGSGGNIIGGKGKLVIAGSNGAPEPIVLGAIDSDAIAREVAKHRDEIKYCYEKEINAEHPDLSGRINVKWVIGASGAVTSAGMASSTMKNPAVEGCVVAVIKRIIFPPVKGGGVVEVTWPFIFRPATG